ncbi:imelysin family protein [Sulfurimonas sp. HSL3-7]|uniref:imelysin family protein n=1 Tax=Sulfonitrofixus jiaomeiensis TaxID=3131938 RepID=UPI0031F7455D
MRALLTALTLSAVLLMSGCGDNAYDGETGLIKTTAAGSASLVSLNNRVLRANSQAASEAAQEALDAMHALETEVNEESYAGATASFVTLMTAWKRVEATYVAQDFEEALIDMPRFIDQFNIGKNSDIPAQMDSVVNGSGDVAAALYTSSHKTLNALEYLLYGDEQNSSAQMVTLMASNPRYAQAAALIVHSLQGHLSVINDYYQESKAFETDIITSTESLLNVLIDSSYKLKEWRIGEPSGFTLKYEDDLDPARAEYHRSRHSLDAVRAILEAHQQVIANGLYDISAAAGAENEATLVNTVIAEALAACDAFENAYEDDIAGAHAARLYDKLDSLHDAYYVSLINALDLTAEIIEADGD